jgi:hypothetical protein
VVLAGFPWWISLVDFLGGSRGPSYARALGISNRNGTSIACRKFHARGREHHVAPNDKTAVGIDDFEVRFRAPVMINELRKRGF